MAAAISSRHSSRRGGRRAEIVNDAGITERKPLLGEDAEAALRRIMETNRYRILTVSRRFAPVLKGSAAKADPALADCNPGGRARRRESPRRLTEIAVAAREPVHPIAASNTVVGRCFLHLILNAAAPRLAVGDFNGKNRVDCPHSMWLLTASEPDVDDNGDGHENDV